MTIEAGDHEAVGPVILFKDDTTLLRAIKDLQHLVLDYNKYLDFEVGVYAELCAAVKAYMSGNDMEQLRKEITRIHSSVPKIKPNGWSWKKYSIKSGAAKKLVLVNHNQTLVVNTSFSENDDGGTFFDCMSDYPSYDILEFGAPVNKSTPGHFKTGQNLDELKRVFINLLSDVEALTDKHALLIHKCLDVAKSAGVFKAADDDELRNKWRDLGGDFEAISDGIYGLAEHPWNHFGELCGWLDVQLHELALSLLRCK